MRIKTYIATTSSGGIELIHKDLGDNAVITLSVSSDDGLGPISLARLIMPHIDINILNHKNTKATQ